MSDDAVGAICLSVDGLDYDVSRVQATITTGNRAILTMNRKQRARYKAKGITTYQLNISVVIPDKKDTVKWLDLEDGRLSIESPDGNYRETFIDCNVTSVGMSYDVNGETMRDLEMFCLDYLDETM